MKREQKHEESEQVLGRKERELKHGQKWWNSEKFRYYLSMEIGIEYKACLYFFTILFFYAMYLLCQGIYLASLLHMLEMILATYGMGYFQVLCLNNFDEAENLSLKQVVSILVCAAIYVGISYWGKWFDRNIIATIVFAFYCILLYVSAFLANKMKRRIDTKQLNVMLQEYQQGGKHECD